MEINPGANTIPKIWLNNFVKNLAKNVSKGNLYISLNLLLPRVISFNFLFQSLTRDKSYSMENLAIFLNGWENLHYELGIERVSSEQAMSFESRLNLL